MMFPAVSNSKTSDVLAARISPLGKMRNANIWVPCDVNVFVTPEIASTVRVFGPSPL